MAVAAVGDVAMAAVTRHTKGCLSDMRNKIGAFIKRGGTLEDVGRIDQSAYAHLKTFEELSALNASRLFRQMEFE